MSWWKLKKTMPQATQAELEAILHGAAIAPLTDRAFLRVTGSDATRWLNGMVTNSTQSLAPGQGNYNFLLNAQGRILGDCTIYREPADGEPAFLLETDNSQLATIQETLDRFIIMDDVELSPTLTEKSGFLLMGPKAKLSLDAGLIWPSEPVSLTYTSGVVDAMVLAISPAVFEVWGNAKVDEWFRKSERIVSPEALEAFRIYSGMPIYGTDIRNTDTAKDLPQETNQTHALHFSKGCYLGQEIVERIRSRGQVHKLFSRFQLSGELPATLPAPLEVEGKPAGELTSAAMVPLPEGAQLFALGYARREFLDLNKQFTYSGGTAVASPHSTVR